MVGQLLKWGFSWRTVSRPRWIDRCRWWVDVAPNGEFFFWGPLEGGVELGESVDFDDFVR